MTAPAAAAFITAGPSNSPRVALTFHGGGDAEIGAALLAAADAHRSPVTVFAVGTWAAANPDLARAFTRSGHELANHTQTHPALGTLERSAVAAEIVGCAETLRAVIGTPGRWFRPSSTVTATALMREESARAGYRTVVGYGVDPSDYTDPGPDEVIRATLADLAPGSIVSLHLGHEGTVAALAAIVAGARARGLEPVTVSTLLRR